MRSGPGFVGCAILIACQNLFSDGVGSAAVGMEVRGVWLVHEVCHVLVIGPKPF